MHHFGRSNILNELYEQSQQTDQPPVHYDIRALSREILLRSKNGTYHTWDNNDGAEVTLRIDPDGRYDSYELFIKEANDTDSHFYTYNGMQKTIRYEYPFGTWHPKKKTAELQERIEAWLLSGPVADKVPDSAIERFIQKDFSPIAGQLIIEHLDEFVPEMKSDMYTHYILSDDAEFKMKIIKGLYSVAKDLGSFNTTPNQFEFAISVDISKFRKNQKQLTQKPESAGQPESS